MVVTQHGVIGGRPRQQTDLDKQYCGKTSGHLTFKAIDLAIFHLKFNFDEYNNQPVVM